MVDGVTGSEVWAKTLRSASGPLHATRQEHTLILTYWNTKVWGSCGGHTRHCRIAAVVCGG